MNRSSITVLYVDDDRYKLDISIEYLRHQHSIDVHTTQSPEEARNLALSGDYDVLIADLMMPGMDGMELMKSLRDDGCRTPFIVFTARDREEAVIEAFDAGADFYVQKGGDPQALFMELATKIYHLHELRHRDRELQMLRRAVDASVDGISMLDSEGNHTYANQTYATMFGYRTPEDVIGLDWRAIYGKDTCKTALEEVKDELRNIGKHSSQTLGRRMNGEIFPLEVSITMLPGNGALIICRDLTDVDEFRQAMDALNNSNQALLNAMPDKMFILDGGGRFLDYHCNPENRLSHPPSMFLERNIGEIFSKTITDITMKKMDEVRSNGGTVQYSYNMSIDDRVRHFDARMTLCGDDRYLIVERDITELIETRSELLRNAKSLEENRRMMDSILMSQQEMVCRFLPDTTLTYVNEAYCRHFNRSPRELIGKRFLELVPEIWHDSILENLSILTPEDPYLSYAHEVVKDDGSIGWQEWQDSGFFDERGELTFLQSVGRDITELIVNREEMDRNDHLKELVSQTVRDINLASMDDANETIHTALERVGEFLGSDRAYLFDYDFKNGHCSNTHEWCSEGIEPQIRILQRSPLQGIDRWVAAHKDGIPIVIPDVGNHDEESIRDILMQQGIMSLVTVPLMDRDRCIGFVGIDSVRRLMDYGNQEVGVLTLLAEGLVTLRKRLDNEMSLHLSDSIGRFMNPRRPDLFFALDMKGDIIHVSPNTEDVLGYRADEVLVQGLGILSSAEGHKLFEEGISHLRCLIDQGRTNEVFEGILRVRRKDGYDVELSTECRLLYEGGEWLLVGAASKV